MVISNLRQGLDPLKEINYEALQTKRLIMKKIFEKSMSVNKRMFLHWNHVAKQ